MSPSATQCIDARAHHIVRRVKIRLADLKVHDVAALGLKGARPDQHFEGCFGSQAPHPVGEAKRMADVSCRASVVPEWSGVHFVFVDLKKVGHPFSQDGVRARATQGVKSGCEAMVVTPVHAREYVPAGIHLVSPHEFRKGRLFS
jgi:hypothetical protein